MLQPPRRSARPADRPGSRTRLGPGQAPRGGGSNRMAAGPAPDGFPRTEFEPKGPLMSIEYPWAEIGLAKKLGVSRQMLAEKRAQFTEGDHWQTCGKSIQWTQDAAEALAAGLGLKLSPPPRLDSPVNEASPLIESVSVTRFRFVNPRVLYARRENREEVAVFVPSNKNFRAGMTLKAQKTDTGWHLVGRCPRFPGKW